MKTIVWYDYSINWELHFQNSVWQSWIMPLLGDRRKLIYVCIHMYTFCTCTYTQQAWRNTSLYVSRVDVSHQTFVTERLHRPTPGSATLQTSGRADSPGIRRQRGAERRTGNVRQPTPHTHTHTHLHNPPDRQTDWERSNRSRGNLTIKISYETFTDANHKHRY